MLTVPPPPPLGEPSLGNHSPGGRGEPSCAGGLLDKEEGGGTQSLFLNRPEHASKTAAFRWFSGSYGPFWTCAALPSQILLPKNVAHKVCVSVELNMHVSRHFSGLSVVHTPSYSPVLLRVARPLSSNRGCEGTVARSCFFFPAGGSGTRP